jgi:hypothetical protein
VPCGFHLLSSTEAPKVLATQTNAMELSELISMDVNGALFTDVDVW